MAVTIFLILNGMGVVFLLYVLAKFWKEGQRQGFDAPKYSTEIERQDRAQVIIITHPISHAAQGGISVIPFQKDRRERAGKQNDQRGARGGPGQSAGLASAR